MFINKKKKSMELVTTAASAFKADNLAFAIELTRKAIATDDRSGAAWFLMGQIQDKIGQRPHAINAYRKAAELEPDKAFLAYFNIGCIMDRAYEWKKSVEYYGMVLKLNRSYTDAWINLGRALDELQQYQEALQAYQVALQLNPNDPDLLINLANTFLHLGQYEKSQAICRKARELNAECERAQQLEAFLEELKKKPPAVESSYTPQTSYKTFSQSESNQIDQNNPANSVEGDIQKAIQEGMQEAIQEVHQKMPHFFRSLATAKSGDQHFLKVNLSGFTQNVSNSLWISDVAFRHNRWIGKVIDQPRMFNLKPDASVNFESKQICDWLIKRENGKIEGSFTGQYPEYIFNKKSGNLSLH